MTPLALCCFLFGAPSPLLQETEPAPPNVLFLLIDDLGVMDVGAYNPDTFYATPHMDRLARSGMRFTNGYAASPVCSPTRYAIMTGRYPARAQVTDYFTGRRAGRFRPAPLKDRMPLEEVTLAEALKEAGYATFFAGKWHLGPSEKFWPAAQGFDVNRGGHSAGAPRGKGKYFPPYGNPQLTDGPEGEHLPDRLATETLRFLAEHTDEPFLAYLSFYSVHTPLMAPQELTQSYRAKAQPDEAIDFADEEQVWPTDNPRRVRVRQNHATYAAMVESVDAAIGRVLDGLEELGLAENTIVCLTSDNGGLSTSEGSPTSNLPLRGGKGWLYEGGIREPFLIRWPGVTAAGGASAEPVISSDFYPTLLEALGLEARPGQHLDGRSLVPLLRGESVQERDLFWHYPHYSNQGGFPGAAIRRGPWKLLERHEDGRVHLYHLGRDPGERNDLAAEEPERVVAMRARLHAWYEEVGALFLEPQEPQQPGSPQPWRPE